MTPLAQLSDLYKRLEEYDMMNDPHGDCIIFSNHFDVTVKASNSENLLRCRKGTEVDEQVLKETFEFLRFNVTIYRNCSGEEMKKIFQEYASQKEQKDNDCFICCILSHGYEGGVYGNDGTAVSTKSIKNIFSGDNCPYLVTKPKLFFIQACQGEQDSGLAWLERDGGLSPYKLSPCMTENGGFDLSWTEEKENIAADADILVFMATTPGTYIK